MAQRIVSSPDSELHAWCTSVVCVLRHEAARGLGGPLDFHQPALGLLRGVCEGDEGLIAYRARS